MPLHTDVLLQMKKRLAHECQRIQSARQEMAKIADKYNRYIDLYAEQERRMQRVQRIGAMLEGDNKLVDAIEQDRSEVIIRTIEPMTWPGSDELPLWETMKEYLLYAKEARIEEIVTFLLGLKIKTANRQAIESALKKHPETFGTRKRGHEKHIFLKDGITD